MKIFKFFAIGFIIHLVLSAASFFLFLLTGNVALGRALWVLYVEIPFGAFAQVGIHGNNDPIRTVVAMVLIAMVYGSIIGSVIYAIVRFSETSKGQLDARR